MISDYVYELCHAQETVSSALAKDPTRSPASAVEEFFGNIKTPSIVESAHHQKGPATPEDLQRAFECGRFGPTRPSDLFLRIFHDALCTLEGDPMVGMTSPPLLGSSGVIPLTILSVLPDICRHMGNCIARAEHEVFLATNFWQASDASTLITNGLRELSRRAGQRGRRAVVKILYDRGNVKQVIDNHQNVAEADYIGGAIKLPSTEEIPNIDMQVVNYHRPMLGTFHSKFMVVDRKIGILCSNNIQDIDNFEMMTHLEGPIVESLYDVCLISWSNALKPPLPCMSTAPTTSGPYGFAEQRRHAPSVHFKGESSPPARDSSEFRHSENGVLNETAVTDEPPLPEDTTKDPHYDIDLAGEAARVQASLQPVGSETRTNAITRHLNTTIQPETKGDAPDSILEDEMTPYLLHPSHEPFPMAMVCRKPWGTPNHSCVHTPQNEAFLSAIRNATTDVFIQTPNLNAEPLIPALLDAVRRGIEVTYYVCLGYNDAGELLPFQGGINEMICHKLYTSLEPAQRKNLHTYFYVGKDMVQPIHNKFKRRSAHVKLLIVDGHIGIQGNGNQDTQSWYHSQEINVMIDSAMICAAWKEGIRRNENTHLYGAMSQEDGIWRDSEGKEAEGSIGLDPGKFSWAKGIVGSVQRVRGVGGF
ncbi:MAG: hypothetical protein M4579_002763 [Chaenotheca gracillima]|nr:MAG: hypothetical protein M4579_002763 [Chaenotheca gracillima]